MTLASTLRRAFRSPTAFLAASVSLAVGLGIASVMLSGLDLLLFRPPPGIEDPGTLKRLYQRREISGLGVLTSPYFSYPFYDALHSELEGTQVAAYWVQPLVVGDGPRAQKSPAGLISSDFFEVLGVHPVRGSLDQASLTERPWVVLSWAFWQERGGGTDLVGTSFEVGGRILEVAAVLPPEFRGVDLERIDLWVSLDELAPAILPGNWKTSTNSAFLSLVLRHSEPSSRKVTEAVASNIYNGQRDPQDGEKPGEILVRALQRGWAPALGREEKIVLWLAALAAITLIVACVNVTNIFLAHLLRHGKEFQIRLALGAQQRHLLMEILVGLTVIAVGGTGLAIAFGTIAARLAVVYLFPDTGVEPAAFLSMRSVALGLGLLALALGGITSLLKLWLSRRGMTVFATLQTARNRGIAETRTRRILITAQTAFTFVLLLVAGLYIRSLAEIQELDLGLDPEYVSAIQISEMEPPLSPFDPRLEQVLADLDRVPGIEVVAASTAMPLETSRAAGVQVPGRGELPALPTGGPYIQAVTTEIFRALGTSLVAGRGFSPSDDRHAAPPVVVINQTMDRVVWPGESAIGKCLQIERAGQSCFQVIGVVRDVLRASIDEGPTMQIYIPTAKAPADFRMETLFFRTRDSSWARDAVRNLIHRRLPDIPFVEARAFADLLQPEIRPWLTGARFGMLFGLVALFLALVGVYGLTLTLVAARRYDLAVQLVLGARRRTLLRLVLLEALQPSAIGVLLGLPLGFVVGGSIQATLFNTEGQDMVTLVAIASLLLGAALMACVLPALRLRWMNPAQVLREG